MLTPLLSCDVPHCHCTSVLANCCTRLASLSCGSPNDVAAFSCLAVLRASFILSLGVVTHLPASERHRAFPPGSTASTSPHFTSHVRPSSSSCSVSGFSRPSGRSSRSTPLICFALRSTARPLISARIHYVLFPRLPPPRCHVEYRLCS
eukprot:9519688-Heterocapsa_arctica.AAC.1